MLEETLELAKVTIWGILKILPENPPIFTPEDQEKFREAIPFLEEAKKSKEFSKIPMFKNFEKYEIIEINGNFSFVREDIAKQYIYDLYKCKKKESKRNIGLLPIKEVVDFQGVTKPKYVETCIAKTIPQLTKNMQSLFNLSISADEFYKQKKYNDAEIIKRSILQRYKEKGLKFCNCYQRGYIENLIYSIEDSIDNIEQEVLNFLERPIFFVSNNTTYSHIEKMAREIISALNRKEEYIAIHSLGSANTKAKKVVSLVNVPKASEYIVIDPSRTKADTGEKDFSTIWYTKPGKKVLSLYL